MIPPGGFHLMHFRRLVACAVLITTVTQVHGLTGAFADTRSHCDIVPCGVPDQIPPSSEIGHELGLHAVAYGSYDAVISWRGGVQAAVSYQKTECDIDYGCQHYAYTMDFAASNLVYGRLSQLLRCDLVTGACTPVGSKYYHFFADNFTLWQTNPDWPAPFQVVYVNEDNHWASQNQAAGAPHTVVKNGQHPGQASCNSGGDCTTTQSGCITVGDCSWSTYPTPTEVYQDATITGRAGIIPDFLSNGSDITSTPWYPTTAGGVLPFAILGRCSACVF